MICDPSRHRDCHRLCSVLFTVQRRKMAASIEGVFEEGLKSSNEAAKVLVVGAGGIGCELLKNLVLSGFKDIEIVSP